MLINKFTRCNLEVQMNVKNIDQLISQMENFEPDLENPASKIQEISDMIGFLVECTNLSKDVVLSRISEKKMVQIMRVIQRMTVFAAASDGEGMTLIAPMVSGELDGYTHSVILATIGVLIKEEVL